MRIVLVPGSDLTAEHVQMWAQWQREDPTLHSPFFRPEFTQHVAAVTPGVEVAVLQEKGAPVGFFPFQRVGRYEATPVGGSMSDFHGVIARPGTVWDLKQLIRGCGLRAWHFHRVPASQVAFRPYFYTESPSRYLDLSKGYAAYRLERLHAGSRQIREALRKARKLAREVGPLRFEPHSTDPQVFETAIRWKIEQYRRMNAVNALAPDWTRQLLARLARLRNEAFGGILSALFAGERLAAVHLGMRSLETVNVWYPAYDPELSSYSPGLILFLKLAEASPELGIQRIDLGSGYARYKLSLGSAAVAVAEGSVDLRPFSRVLRQGRYQAVRWLRSSPLSGPARMAIRLMPRLRRWASFT